MPPEFERVANMHTAEDAGTNDQSENEEPDGDDSDDVITVLDPSAVARLQRL